MNSLHSVIDGIESKKYWVADNFDRDIMNLACEQMIAHTDTTQCFDIGEADNLPQFADDYVLQTPFDFCWFEFHQTNKDQVPCRWGIQSIKGKRLIALIIWSKEKSKPWCLSYSATCEAGDEGHLRFGYFPPTADSTSVISLVNVIYKYCHAMACSNVHTIDHPPNRHWQMKRLKRGKQPLYSYKTLHIQLPNIKIKNQNQGGTHASPRLHLRRGHRRTYGPGRWIWIDPMLVGDITRGVVRKDYATDYLPKESTQPTEEQ